MDLPYQLENTVHLHICLRITHHHFMCNIFFVVLETRYHWHGHICGTTIVRTMARHERWPVTAVSVDKATWIRTCLRRLHQAVRKLAGFLPQRSQGWTTHRVDQYGTQERLHRLVQPIFQTREREQVQYVHCSWVWRTPQNFWGLFLIFVIGNLKKNQWSAYPGRWKTVEGN